MKKLLLLAIILLTAPGCTTMLPWGNVKSSPNKIIATHSADRTILVVTSEDPYVLEPLMKNVEKILTDRWNK